MNKTHFICLLVSLILVSCQSTFRSERKYAQRKYVKTEAVASAEINSPPGEHHFEASAAEEKNNITPARHTIKDEQKKTGTGPVFRTPAKIKTKHTRPLLKKQPQAPTALTEEGPGLNIASLVCSALAVIAFFACLFAILGTGFAAGLLFFILMPIYVILAAIGLGLGIAGVAGNGPLKGLGIAGIAAGGAVLLALIILLLIIFL